MGDAKPFIIPVFIPHSGCPHRCIFCNQVAVTGSHTPMPEPEAVEAEISRFLRYKSARRTRTEISFFGGNFLGLPPRKIGRLLDCAAGFVHSGQADGIRFSTRPDTVSPVTLDTLAAFPVTTIELGVQSMDDRILALAQRGHSAADTVHAVAQLKEKKYRIGLQMMVGLPGEDVGKTMTTGAAIAELAPDFVRIYPTLVIRGSELARWHAAGRYTPLEMADCISRVKQLHQLFTKRNIPVIRMGLQANEGLDAGADLVAGPYHPSFGQMVLSERFYDAAAGALEKGPASAQTAVLRVHPRQISTIRGQKNIKMERLYERFTHIKSFKVKPDQAVARMQIKIQFPGFNRDVKTDI